MGPRPSGDRIHLRRPAEKLTSSNMLSEKESYEILGVAIDATQDEIIAARRRLARTAHPDSGGTHGAMVEINEACRVLLAARSAVSAIRSSGGEGATPPTVATEDTDDGADATEGRRRHGFRDAPSFVINALPVEAFDIMLVAAANIGEVVDDDPPYLLEVLVREPGPLWCRFELFPDAGSTTVMLSCDVEVGYRVYSIEEIRDLWISLINAMSSRD